jgi:hypothetical protein
VPLKRPLKWSVLFCAALAARLLAADAAPPPAAMDPLFDNGRSFGTWDRRLALHCLDVPGLLALGPDQRGQELDKAAAAGFNAVSFEAPLFGAQGLCHPLGRVDADAGTALTQALAACGLRRLYAFPVLYPPAGVDGLIGTATARAVFFSGRRSWAWQCWALRQMAALTIQGAPLTQAPEVGGWILYRGAWPGGPPVVSGSAQDSSPSAASLDPVRLRLWTTSTVQFARKLGFRQELGIGLWARDDLGAAPAEAPPSLDASADGAPPMAAPSEVSFSAQDLERQSAVLDVLPPVAEANALDVDDSSVLPVAPDNPWELEGLDWPAVESLFTALPMASQLNFVEFTLDTEDWYEVGKRLAQAADKAEVPVLWRQDWRSASRYERGRHLAAPAPLAGLSGPWPDDDWPADGGALWAMPEASVPQSAPFRVQGLSLERKGDRLVLKVRLSRPAKLTVEWGRTLPLISMAIAPDEPGITRRVTLTGLGRGAWFLLKLKAVSPRYGVCLLRTRWVRAPL